MLPQHCPVSPMDVLPNRHGLWDSLLHPLVVQSLGTCLSRPDVAGVLKMQPFTLRDADQTLLQHMLPPMWGKGTSVSVAWQDGMQASTPHDSPTNFKKSAPDREPCVSFHK